MSKLGIGTGIIPNDGTGDTLLAGGIKINNNFNEIYGLIGDGTSLFPGIVTSIVAGTGITIFPINGIGQVTINSTSTGVGQTSYWNLTSTGISTLSNVGIGTTNCTSTLTVNGSGQFINNDVTANNFIGNLTGTATSATTTSQVYIRKNITTSISGISWCIPFVDDAANNDLSLYITGDHYGARWHNPTKSLFVTSNTAPQQNGPSASNSSVISPTSITVGPNISLNSTSGITSSPTLNATTGNITNISGVAGTITTLNATTGIITNISGVAGTITTLNSTTGSITNLNGTNVNYTGIGSIGTLDINKVQFPTSGDALVVHNGGDFRIYNAGDVGSVNLYCDTSGILSVAGIVTASTFSGNLGNTLTLNTTGIGLTGLASFNNSGAATFTVTSNATPTNNGSTIVSRDASGNFSAGTITATLSGNASSATYATSSGVSTSVSGGIASVTSLTASGISTLGVTSATNLTSQQLNVSGLSTFSGITTHTTSLFGTQARFSGIVTASSFSGNLANTLTLATSGTGLSGSTTFNNSGAATFTVTSNATSANTASTIVARNASGDFSAGIVTATTLNTSTVGSQTSGILTTTTTNQVALDSLPTATYQTARYQVSIACTGQLVGSAYSSSSASVGTITAGAGYTQASYTNVTLTGGTGNDARANIGIGLSYSLVGFTSANNLLVTTDVHGLGIGVGTIAVSFASSIPDSSFTGFAVTAGNIYYAVGVGTTTLSIYNDSAGASQITGIGTTTFSGVGNTMTKSGGVTSVIIVYPGSGYSTNDSLGSAGIGSLGSGFSFTVSSVVKNYQSTDIMILQSVGSASTSCDYAEYATIGNNEILGSFSADISGTNARLLFTPTYRNNTIKYIRSAVGI